MATEILIVDDNADIRNILNDLILDAGYKTRLAANYNQALAEIYKKIPDVAILDVNLDKSDIDGIELLTHIKSKNREVLCSQCAVEKRDRRRARRCLGAQGAAEDGHPRRRLRGQRRRAAAVAAGRGQGPGV